MKAILAIFAIILALVAIGTWIHPVVSAAIIAGGSIGTVIAGCIKQDTGERDRVCVRFGIYVLQLSVVFIYEGDFGHLSLDLVNECVK